MMMSRFLFFSFFSARLRISVSSSANPTMVCFGVVRFEAAHLRMSVVGASSMVSGLSDFFIFIFAWSAGL